MNQRSKDRDILDQTHLSKGLDLGGVEFNREVDVCPGCGKIIGECWAEHNKGYWSCYECKRTFTAPMKEVRRHKAAFPLQSLDYVLVFRIVPKNIREVPFRGEYIG